MNALQQKLAQLDKDIKNLERIGRSNLSPSQIERLEDLAMEMITTEREAKKAGPRLTVVDDNSYRSSGVFKSLGEQLMAVRNSAMPGAKVDSRLYEVRAATGMSETVPSDGGFLVQNDFTQKLFSAVFGSDIVSQCETINISSNSNSVKVSAVDETSRVTGSRWGGIRVFMADEASEKTASKPKFRQLELNLRKLVGLCYATDELMEDVSVLEKTIAQGFEEEMSFQLQNFIVRGTGAGEPLGILNSGCLVSVTKETGQAADTVVLANIYKMKSRMLPRARAGARWYINPEVEPQLEQLVLPVGTGGSAVPAYQNGQLVGFPCEVIEHCSGLGDLGDILFCSWPYYLLARKGGMQSDMSIHVRFIYDESVFRFVVRVDGQPFYSSPITPFLGTNTLSPFVTLQART